MRYKIEITEIGTEEKICGKDWKEGVDPDPATNGYGYTPEIVKTVDYSRVIYRQETAELDLPIVILAINDIKILAINDIKLA